MLEDMKKELSSYYKLHRNEYNLTYRQLVVDSGLCLTQVTNILKHDGHMLTLDKILMGLSNLGYSIEINIGSYDE